MVFSRTGLTLKNARSTFAHWNGVFTNILNWKRLLTMHSPVVRLFLDAVQVDALSLKESPMA